MDINEELEKLKVVLDQLKELGFKNVEIGWEIDQFRFEIGINASKDRKS